MLAKALQFGPVGLETNLLLAPIAGWCDLAWRETVRECGGVGLACTDLLSPTGLIGGSEASADLARTSDLDQPIGMQLYGSDPAVMAAGAQWCVEHGATVVDINMGCPVDKVTKKDGGSKLMCDLGRAERIAAAVRAAMPERVPLTCKMRLGWDEAACDAGCAGELAVRLVRAGAAGITVHGRTTEQRFKGACRLDGIRRVVERAGEVSSRWPVMGSGDGMSGGFAVVLSVASGCAGGMIGRGAFARPRVFAEAWAAQQGEELAEQTDAEAIGVIRRYFDRMIEYRGEHRAMHVMRQKISWLGRSVSGGHCKPLKDAVRTAREVGAVRHALDEWVAAGAAADGGGTSRERRSEAVTSP